MLISVDAVLIGKRRVQALSHWELNSIMDVIKGHNQ
jgi:hypothetical protein